MTVAREVELTATEYELLRVLSLNAGRVVAYDALMRQVWSGRKKGAPSTLCATSSRSSARSSATTRRARPGYSACAGSDTACLTPATPDAPSVVGGTRARTHRSRKRRCPRPPSDCARCRSGSFLSVSGPQRLDAATFPGDPRVARRGPQGTAASVERSRAGFIPARFSCEVAISLCVSVVSGVSPLAASRNCQPNRSANPRRRLTRSRSFGVGNPAAGRRCCPRHARWCVRATARRHRARDDDQARQRPNPERLFAGARAAVDDPQLVGFESRAAA